MPSTRPDTKTQRNEQSASSPLRSASCLLSLASCLLLWLLFVQATRGAVNASITFDEGIHLTAGYTLVRTGDWRLQPAVMHPPFIHILSAAPLLLDPALPDPRAVDGWEIASLSALTDTLVWQCRSPARLALAGRLPVILLAVLLGALVYRWAADIAGPKAGLIALVLYTFDPNIITHSQLVTTDMGFTALGLATVYCYSRYSSLSPPCNSNSRPMWLVGTGALLGITLAAKVSAGLLVITLAAMVLLDKGSLLQRSGRLAIIGLVAFGALWAVYGFETAPVPGIPLPLPAATHIEIYRVLQQHYLDGHPAFLMGMNSSHGWWYYFPITFLIKTPLPTLILFLIAVARGKGESRKWKVEGGKWVLLAFPVLHFGTAMFSSVDIGYRHLLPILPFLFVFIGAQLAGHRPKITPSPRHLVTLSPCLLLSALLLWHIAGAVAISPHHIAYFNELAGGAENGYHWLVDSNLDWGQNLWELREWMQANSVDRIYYAHYSPARPEVYGVQADLLPPSPRAVPFTPWSPAPGIYAIGATVLQGAYLPDVNTYAWFRHQTPIARIGSALFIYKVKPQTDVTWAAVCADPLPVLAPQQVQTYQNQPGLRVILIDCHQSWAYPAGDSAGVFVLPIGAPPPPGATLELETRRPDGKPFYRVYRIEQRLSPAQNVNGLPVWAVHDITLDGPLTLTGYWVNRAGAYPGDAVELWTLWQVNQVPARPLSLMAHLVGEDGSPIAIGDGLGVPIEQWRPGDVIVQRHSLRVPPGTRSQLCSIQTGAYWLDTLERWPVRRNQEIIGDQLKLSVIGILN